MANSTGPISDVEHEVQLFIAALKQDNYSLAKSLFARNQAAGLFPKGEKLLLWLVTTIGKKPTLKFVNHFVHSPCIYCRQGLKKCENCGGKGHLGYEMICDSCFGFGIKPCEFCAGAGWCTIDFVPPGLRFAVFVERIQIAKKRIKAILLRPLSETLKTEEAKDPLTRYIQYLFDLNKQLVVLETMSDTTKQLVREVSPEKCNEKISQFAKKSIKTIFLSKRRIAEIITQIITLSKIEAGNPDSDAKHRQLFSERIKYLTALLTSTPRFAGTFLEHPFLNNEARKLGLKVE